MSTPYIGFQNLQANNETTYSVVDNVPAVVLSLGINTMWSAQIIRPFNINPNWNLARFSFKMAFTQAGSSTVDAYMFWGLCSSGQGVFSPTAHCIGACLGNNGDDITQNAWNGVYSPVATNPGGYIGYEGYAVWPAAYSGSGPVALPILPGGSGYGRPFMPSCTATYPSNLSSSLLGNNWTNVFIEIQRNYSGLSYQYGLRFMWGAYWGNVPYENNSLNIPRRMVLQGMQTQEGSFGYSPPLQVYDNFYYETGLTNNGFLDGGVRYTSQTINEKLNGPLNCVNIGITYQGGNIPPPLAIRDMTMAWI